MKYQYLNFNIIFYELYFIFFTLHRTITCDIAVDGNYAIIISFKKDLIFEGPKQPMIPEN